METKEQVTLPSKERFASYVKLQMSGTCNMMHYYSVYKDVMDNYGALAKLYPDVVK